MAPALHICLAILPSHGPASSETPKAVAKKGDGKGRAPAAPVTAATVIASDMPVILVAPGTVEPFANVAVKTRVDGQIVEVPFKEGDLVKEGDVLFRLDDRHGEGADRPGRGEHRQGPGEPARCRGDAWRGARR